MCPNTVYPSKRSGTLDLLRFFAVLLVFFGHYTDTFNYKYHIVPSNFKYIAVSSYASLALTIFFMVSGYVVTMTSMKRNIKDFTIARFSRIYPLFWISCLAAFILPRIVNHSFLYVSSVKEFLINLTMVPSLFGVPFINSVFHTLLIEISFYCFIAIIIIFKLWDRILLIITLLLVFCLIYTYNNILSVVNIDLLPLLAGMLCYLISINYAAKWKLYTLLGINFFCISMLAKPSAVVLNMQYTDMQPVNMWVTIVYLTIVYLIFILLAQGKLAIKSHPISKFLGEIAYSFYLFHIYFLVFYYYLRNTIQGDVLLLFILASVIIVSWIIHLFIETPLASVVSKFLYKLTGGQPDRKKKTTVTI